MILGYVIAKIRREAQGGAGPPGGVWPQGFMMSAEYGGPRWYPYQDSVLKEMHQWVKDQTRYHPTYIGMGSNEDLFPGDDWVDIKEMGDPFLGKNPVNIELMIIPERQEGVALMLKDKSDGTFRMETVPKEYDDIGKQKGNWKLLLVPSRREGAGYRLIGRKLNGGGERKGIFEINGDPALPGPIYIDTPGPAETPGATKTGDMTPNLWENWRAVDRAK